MSHGLDVAVSIADVVAKAKEAGKRLDIAKTAEAISKLHKDSGYSSGQIAEVLSDEDAAPQSG